MTDEQLRLCVERIVSRLISEPVAVDLLMELIKEEKSLSYGGTE